MGNENAVNIQVGQDVIKPIVQAKVQAALVEAFGREAKLLENAIQAILTQKVDSNGQYSNYSGKPLIEWLSSELVKETAKQAIKEFVATKKGVLLAEFERQFAKKSKTIAEKMVSGILDSVNASWGFSLSVDYKDRKD